MSVLRVDRVAAASLLLAALTFSNVAPHGHDSPLGPGTSGHAERTSESEGLLPAFHATQTERATRIESFSCLACVHQRWQEGAVFAAVPLGPTRRVASSLEADDDGQPANGTSLLPGSRAPPRPRT